MIDYVRSSVTHFGGVSPLRKLLDFAARYQIESAMHGPEDISPVGMAAAVHLDLAVHNFGIQEYSGHTPLTERVFRHAYTFTDGHPHPGEAPAPASNRTRNWPSPTRTTRRICRSTASRTGPCTTGDTEAGGGRQPTPARTVGFRPTNGVPVLDVCRAPAPPVGARCQWSLR